MKYVNKLSLGCGDRAHEACSALEDATIATPEVCSTYSARNLGDALASGRFKSRVFGPLTHASSSTIFCLACAPFNIWKTRVNGTIVSGSSADKTSSGTRKNSS